MERKYLKTHHEPCFKPHDLYLLATSVIHCKRYSVIENKFAHFYHKDVFNWKVDHECVKNRQFDSSIDSRKCQFISFAIVSAEMFNVIFQFSLWG